MLGSEPHEGLRAAAEKEWPTMNASRVLKLHDNTLTLYAKMHPIGYQTLVVAALRVFFAEVASPSSLSATRLELEELVVKRYGVSRVRTVDVMHEIRRSIEKSQGEWLIFPY